MGVVVVADVVGVEVTTFVDCCSTRNDSAAKRERENGEGVPKIKTSNACNVFRMFTLLAQMGGVHVCCWGGAPCIELAG